MQDQLGATRVLALGGESFFLLTWEGDAKSKQQACLGVGVLFGKTHRLMFDASGLESRAGNLERSPTTAWYSFRGSRETGNPQPILGVQRLKQNVASASRLAVRWKRAQPKLLICRRPKKSISEIASRSPSQVPFLTPSLVGRVPLLK